MDRSTVQGYGLNALFRRSGYSPEQHRLEERLEFERSLGGLTPGQKAQFLRKLKDSEERLRKVG